MTVGLLSGPALRRLGARRFAAYGISLLAVAVGLRAVPYDPVAWACAAAVGVGLPAALIAVLTGVQQRTPARCWAGSPPPPAPWCTPRT